MLRNLIELKKALDMTAAGGILLQPEVDKVIQSLILVNNPLRANLARKKGSGKAWIIVRRSASGAAAFKADTADFGETESTYDAWVEFPFKNLGRKGKVTKQLILTGMSYADVKSQEINDCLDAVRDKEEYTLINGDAVGTPLEFSGFRTLIPAGQQLSLGTNGGILTLKAMDEAIDKCYGVPDMIICSKRTRRELTALLQQFQRFTDTAEVKGGFKLKTYNDIPIYWSQHISDAQTQGGVSNASDLFIIDSTKAWVGVLEELHMEALAKVSSQYDSFDVVERESLVFANTKYHSRIVGIIPPA